MYAYVCVSFFKACLWVQRAAQSLLFSEMEMMCNMQMISTCECRFYVFNLVHKTLILIVYEITVLLKGCFGLCLEIIF